MKDTFNLREFLAENKLTEAGRKDTRYHFGEVILSEVFMRADEFEAEGPNGVEPHDDEEFMGSDMVGIPDMDPEDDSLDEAGYTDDFEDFGGDDDLDFSAGDSMVNALGGKKAKKAFDKTNDVNFEEPDEPAPSDSDEFQDPENIDDAPEQATSSGLADQLKYDPSGIEFEMDNAELDEFLNGFRRPQVAVKVLQRAIDQAQAEANEGSIKKFYLVLDNGFYKTVAFRKGNVIATVRKTK